MFLCGYLLIFLFFSVFSLCILSFPSRYLETHSMLKVAVLHHFNSLTLRRQSPYSLLYRQYKLIDGHASASHHFDYFNPVFGPLSPPLLSHLHKHADSVVQVSDLLGINLASFSYYPGSLCLCWQQGSTGRARRVPYKNFCSFSFLNVF